jgi:hypothetical protein
MATIQFGVATRDITPPFHVMLHGYADRDHLTDAVSEPIQVSALCLEGAAVGGKDRSRLVVLTLDMIGVQAADVELIREDLARECGVGGDELLVAASHTHFAPCMSLQLFAAPSLGVLEPDQRFVSLVRAAAVEVVRECCRVLKQGELQYHRTSVPSVLFNRRTILRGAGPTRSVETNFLYPEDPSLYEFSPVDPELVTLRVVENGVPRAVLANFGCHPVTGGAKGPGSHYDISADYPYYLRQVVGSAWGCPVLFTLGTAGDAVPLQRAGHSREQIGAVLGNSILMGERVFAASSGSSSGETVMAHSVVRMEARTILSTRGVGAEEAYRAARKAWIAAGSGGLSTDALSRLDTAALCAFRARLYPEDSFVIEVAIHRIGDVVLVGFPFEVLSDTALVLKQHRPGVVVVTIANGYQGYLPKAYEYDRGGYEATAESTHFEPGTADRLLERVMAEMDRL